MGTQFDDCHVRRLGVIVNSTSGIRRGGHVLNTVRPLFSSRGIQLEVFPTERRGHGREIVRSIDLDPLDGLVVIGGDGTIFEVLNGFMERTAPKQTPLGFIPAGSGNSIAAHLAIASLEDAVNRIANGKTRPADVARVATDRETYHCLNIIGWGAAVDINHTAERLRFLGTGRYTIAALWQILRAVRRRAKLVIDDREFDDEFLMMVACNTRYTGKRMLLAPRAEFADGKIDVVFVRHATRMQMLKLFSSVYSGAHVNLPFVEYHQATSLRLETRGNDQLNLDGETQGRSPVSVELLPQAIRYFDHLS